MVKVIFDKVYEVVLGYIRNNCVVMDKIVEVLLEKEMLFGEEFRVIFFEYIEIFVENC